MTCWWMRGPPPGNLGDVLAPVILSGLGIDVEWSPKSSADMIATGSIINAATPGRIVWGSGAMTMEDTPSPEAIYLAVRGPLTAEVVRARGGRCPEVYGDPALLLPEIHNDPVEKRYTIGVVPHYVDWDIAVERYDDAHIISPLRADPLEVVDEIRACDYIVSSSLHGLIVAEAYDIPWSWVEMSDRLHGDGTKFRDFFATTGIDTKPLMHALHGVYA